MVSFKYQQDSLNHFRGISTDYPTKCNPTKGKLDGVVLLNGDELYLMDTEEVHLWDGENKKWL